MKPRRFRPSFRNPFRPHALRDEVDDELAFHIEERRRELEAAGLSREAAHEEALARFGHRGRWQARALRERRRRSVEVRLRRGGQGLIADVREASRRLLRRPTFALVCVLVLAAGIGSSTAVIAIVDATVLRSLPFGEPDRVVRLYSTLLPRFEMAGLAPGHYFDIKDAATSFAALSTTVPTSRTVFVNGPRRLPVLLVEPSFFDVLGVEPFLGRRLIPDDERPGADAVAVATYDFWRRQLQGDPAALGQPLRMGNGSITVVGVMPEGFDFPAYERPQLFIPFRGDRTYREWTYVHSPIGRLSDGVSVEAADREAKALARRLVDAYPEATREPGSGLVMSAVVQPFREDFFWDATGRAFLYIIGGAITLLLAVACLNSAGLLIAHTLERRREMSVRAALGASRWQLARGVMVETAALTFLGLIGGVWIGRWLLEAIQDTSPWVPLLDTARMDTRVMLLAVSLTFVVWVLSGFAPAVLGTQVSVGAVLKEGGRTSTDPVHWSRRVNIVAQFALCCTLMTGAGLAMHGYVALTSVDPGFDPDGVAALQLSLPRARYTEAVAHPESPADDATRAEPEVRVLPDAHEFTRRVIERLAVVPGVVGAAAGTFQPFDGWATTGYFHEDVLDESIPYREKRQHHSVWVTPDYFATLDIRLLEGRFLREQDDSGAPSVVVINRAFADSLRSEGRQPVGATLLLHPLISSPPATFEVVGVVANTALKRSQSAPDAPAAYFSFAQQRATWWTDLWGAGLSYRTFVVRARDDVARLLPDLQQAVWAVDPDVPLEYGRTLESMRSEQYRFARFILLILGSFAAISLLLAAAGTFALLAQAVRSRVHEIGVRKALGSSSGGVAMHFLLDGLRMAGVGTVLGIMGSMAIDGLLRNQLAASPWMSALAIDGWRVGPQAAVVAVLVLAAVVGSWGPAWVASRVNPLDALRAE